jgi:hypothetical protein
MRIFLAKNPRLDHLLVSMRPDKKNILIHYKADPQYFVFLKAGLEFSLPRDLGFDERVVRMTCDKCALNPLEECTLVEALLQALEELSMNQN